MEDSPTDRDRIRRGFNKSIENFSRTIVDYVKQMDEVNNHNVCWAEVAIASGQIKFTGFGRPPIQKVAVQGQEPGWMLIYGWQWSEKKKGLEPIWIRLYPERRQYDQFRKRR